MLNESGCARDFDPNPRESDPNVHRSRVPDGSYFTEMPYLWALSSDGTARFLADASSCAPDQGVTMNKTEFVGHVAKRAEATHAESQRFVQAVLDEVLEALKKGEDVAFAGFGKFSVSHRAARTGVNPQDPSKKVSIPARVVPRFTPGAVLKEQVATGNAKKLAPKKK